MQVNIQKNIEVKGFADRVMLTDICYPTEASPSAVVLYAHGFNGFKDWGRFDLIAHQFAEAGMCFIKFNFSHNGTTVSAPEDFEDLEAFGRNNYSIELYDLDCMLDWIDTSLQQYVHSYSTANVFLIGHSMGGGLSIIKAAEDARIKKLVTWASIAECTTPWGSWSDEKIKEWKSKGVAYYLNGRTQQQMPLHYQLYEDYQEHAQRLNIEAAIKRLQIPVMIIHGRNDPAVPVEKAYLLHQWNPSSQLFINNGDHVFGRKHPWPHLDLPSDMQEVVDTTISFLKS